jgi:hypothetical protein
MDHHRGYPDMQLALQEDPEQMRIWANDAIHYRTGQLRMVGSETYAFHLAHELLVSCFDTHSTTQDTEAVLWKKLPKVLHYWLTKTIVRCLDKLFKQDTNACVPQPVPALVPFPGLQVPHLVQVRFVAGVEADGAFLKRLWREARQIGIEMRDEICKMQKRQSWNGSLARLASTNYFGMPNDAFAGQVHELANVTDEEYTEVFRSKFKHLEVLLQSALTIILYTRADTAFVTEHAHLPASVQVFADSTFAFAEDLLANDGHQPRFADCDHSQQRILFHTANMMRIANTFVTCQQRKGRLMEVSSRLVERIAYSTGGGSSPDADRRAALFVFISGVSPEKRPRARTSKASIAVHFTAQCASPRTTSNSTHQGVPGLFTPSPAPAPANDTCVQLAACAVAAFSAHTDVDSQSPQVLSHHCSPGTSTSCQDVSYGEYATDSEYSILLSPIRSGRSAPPKAQLPLQVKTGPSSPGSHHRSKSMTSSPANLGKRSLSTECSGTVTLSNGLGGVGSSSGGHDLSDTPESKQSRSDSISIGEENWDVYINAITDWSSNGANENVSSRSNNY